MLRSSDSTVGIVATEDDIRLARQVLSAFPMDVPAAAIDCPAFARGFSGAGVFRVQTGEGAYCLRRWPHGGLSETRLRELHRFLTHLQQTGISVIPSPLQCTAGETLISSAGSLWQVEPWLPGTADFHTSPTDQRLQCAMHHLARVHLAAERYRASASGQRWFAAAAAAPSPAVGERLEIIAHWSSERVSHTAEKVRHDPHEELRSVMDQLLVEYQATHPFVQTELQQARSLGVRVHPCLRDVWHDHVLFQSDEVTGLIDPAATRTENVAADLSRLLGSLVGDDDERWGHALEAYSTLRPLSHEERRLVGCLDRSGVLLSGLTWIDRRLSGQLREADLPRVIGRLRIILDRLRNLTGKRSSR